MVCRINLDERRARLLAHTLTDEERLRQNDRLSALWAAAHTARRTDE